MNKGPVNSSVNLLQCQISDLIHRHFWKRTKAKTKKNKTARNMRQILLRKIYTYIVCCLSFTCGVTPRSISPGKNVAGFLKPIDRVGAIEIPPQSAKLIAQKSITQPDRERYSCVWNGMNKIGIKILPIFWIFFLFCSIIIILRRNTEFYLSFCFVLFLFHSTAEVLTLETQPTNNCEHILPISTHLSTHSGHTTSIHISIVWQARNLNVFFVEQYWLI